MWYALCCKPAYAENRELEAKLAQLRLLLAAQEHVVGTINGDHQTLATQLLSFVANEHAKAQAAVLQL